MLDKWVLRAIFSKGPKGRTEAHELMFFHIIWWGQDMKFTVYLELAWTERWASKRKWVRGSGAGKIPDRRGCWWPRGAGEVRVALAQALPMLSNMSCLQRFTTSWFGFSVRPSQTQISESLEAPCLCDICSHWSLSQGLWSLGRRHHSFYFCRCSKKGGLPLSRLSETMQLWLLSWPRILCWNFFELFCLH